jgi:hypothetical protein
MRATRQMAQHLERSGRVRVAAPFAKAFKFFTPDGERAWVPGWDPEYLHPRDGTLVEGLTFRTRHQLDEVTLWLVSRCDEARGAIEYVRVTPGSRMGTVSVLCVTTGAVQTEASITYRLTALSEAGEAALDAFAAEFSDMLATWERHIADALRGPGSQSPTERRQQ